MESQEQHPEDLDLQKYWRILKRGWLPGMIVWLATIGLSVFNAVSTEDTYEAYGKLRFSKQSATSGLVTETGGTIGTLESLSSSDNPLDTEVEIIKSAPIVNETIAVLGLTNPEGETVSSEGFIKTLGLKNIPGTDILLVVYESPNGEEAKEVVDTVMRLYIENNIRLNRAEAKAAREFISTQLPKTEKALLKAEEALRSFKEQYNIVNLDTELRQTVEQIGQLNTQIDQLQGELERFNGRARELQTKIGIGSEEALILSTLSDASGVQQVVRQLQQIEDQLALERTRFREGNPTIVSLENKRAALETLLIERVDEVLPQSSGLGQSTLQPGALQKSLAENLVNVDVEVQGIDAQLQYLEQVKSAYLRRANTLPKLEQIQQDLQRKVLAAQTAYETLSTNLQQVKITENQAVANAQIIEQAIVSPDPVSTSKKKIVMAGAVVGGVLYVITAFIFELIDPTLKTSRELQQIFNYPLLGMIPLTTAKMSRRVKATVPELFVRTMSNEMVGEAYRMVQANLKNVTLERNVIVVTSAVSKEGKSTVAANLAVAIAELGSRVLIIDADLRHGLQSRIWDQSNEGGLGDIILYQTPWRTVVNTVMPNVDLLVSGIVTPGSLTLLGSKQMHLLIQECKQHYDIVIVDTPPLLLVADALSLGRITDGTVLVSRPGIIDSAGATAARDLLNKSGQNILGLITNGVAIENEPNSYFRYAQRYHKSPWQSPHNPATPKEETQSIQL